MSADAPLPRAKNSIPTFEERMKELAEQNNWKELIEFGVAQKYTIEEWAEKCFGIK